MVHRDIKPSNLVSDVHPYRPRRWSDACQRGSAEKEIASHGVVKTLDLGLARLYPIGTAAIGGTKVSLDGFVVVHRTISLPNRRPDSHSVDIRA